MNYYSIITNNGLINHANASANEVNLDLVEMAIGDSNGVYYDPDGTETTLQNELYRVDLTHVVIDENNPNQLIVEAVLDEVVGPFYIREVGIFDSNGDLFAIGKFPETFKPNLPSGSGKRLYIRMILGFASSPNVNLIINNDISLDPNFSTDVNNALAARLIKTNNLSDLENLETARNNLGLNVIAITDFCSCILPFASQDIPDGWLECNGAEISRTTYENLFNKIGEIYGSGDGVNTFNIPDLRGEFIRGFDNTRGVDVGRVFASSQTDSLQNITGTLGMSYSAIRGEEGKTGVFIGSSNANGNNISAPSFPTSQPHGTLNFDASNSSGARTSSETRPRNIAMKYVIKY